MKNIEIKARLAHRANAEQIARELTGQSHGFCLIQRDTYYYAPSGRLKLREITGDTRSAEVIAYARTDVSEPRPSHYTVSALGDPDAMKNVLARAFGIWGIVQKERTLYKYRNVRIHLDRVENLGDFIEFEAVMDGSRSEEDERKRLEGLIRLFGLERQDLLPQSYSDLLLPS